MGTYVMFTKEDMKRLKYVTDKELQELFDEALQHDKSLLISEFVFERKRRWFGKKENFYRYVIYHECYLPNGNTAYEAKEQLSAGNIKNTVVAYLYGIINGSLANRKLMK